MISKPNGFTVYRNALKSTLDHGSEHPGFPAILIAQRTQPYDKNCLLGVTEEGNEFGEAAVNQSLQNQVAAYLLLAQQKIRHRK